MTAPEDSDLETRIARAKAAHEKPDKAKRLEDSAGSVSAGGMALRYGAEFGASVFVGIMMGLGIDSVFNTKPWGLLTMMAFGLAAGVLGVIRAYRELTARANAAMSPSENGNQTEELKS